MCLECGQDVGKTINWNHFLSKCSGNVKSLAEYKQKYPKAVTKPESVKSSCAPSLESMVRKHGDALGKQKYKEYCKKLSYKNSLEAFINKGKTKRDWEDYNSSRAITKKNLIKKYGEKDGLKRWDSYKNKQRRAGNTLDWFQEKYGDEVGAAKFAEVCKSKGITLENLSKKYGVEEGFIRYNKFLEDTKCNFVSLSGVQFVKDIVEFLPEHYIFHDGTFSKEFCIYDEKPYLFDFTITHPIKIIVEFNGDYWHANPKKYKHDELVSLRGGKIAAHKIWERDQHKITIANKRGFQVLTIWESDYISDRHTTIKRVLEWILKQPESLI